MSIPQLPAEELFTQYAFDGREEIDEVIGFAHKVFGPMLLGFDGVFEVSKAGEHDNLDIRVVFLDKFEDFEAVDAGHFDIQEDKIEFLGLDLIYGLISV